MQVDFIFQLVCTGTPPKLRVPPLHSVKYEYNNQQFHLIDLSLVFHTKSPELFQQL